jgi:hypothetical protein
MNIKNWHGIAGLLFIVAIIASCGSGGSSSPDSSNNTGVSDQDIWTIGSVTTLDGVTTASLSNSYTKTNNGNIFYSYAGTCNFYKDNTIIKLNGGEVGGLVYDFAAYNLELLHLPVTLNSSWTGTSNAAGYTYSVTTTINSVTDTVTTLDNTTWNNCVFSTDNFVFPNGYNPDPNITQVQRWYCPGIGPVKFTIYESVPDYKIIQYTFILKSYTGEIVPGDYFPLTTGRTWVFVNQ